MRGSHYTAEQNAFIAERYSTMTYSELAKRYNEKFGTQMTPSAIGKKINYMGLPQKERTYKSRFTAEADEYLRENAFNYTSSELSGKLLDLFDIQVATQTVTDRLNALGIHRGNNFVPNGYIPRASKPIGTERIVKGRTVMVKIAQPDVWITKAQSIMGYDPKEYQAIFLDGNSLNVTPENIVVVSKRVHARLAKNGWLNSSSEVIRAGIKWSELLYALKEVTDDGK